MIEWDECNKTDEQLAAKCNEIIDGLKDFNMAARHRVVSTIYHSFISLAKDEGIEFMEIEDTDNTSYPSTSEAKK